MDRFDYDVAVVGSGFGGSVAALRLAQKGYRVGVIEAGRRWAPDDFPRTNWDVRKYFWMPRLGCYGLQRMDQLRDVMIASGAGVGGGSLIYGNTLFTPLEPFFDAPIIRELGGGEGLLPYYRLARRMMGVVPNPRLFEPDRILRETAAEYGREDTFTPSPVGVYFGEPERTVPDPYFLGEGPARAGCNFCGGCFIGCRHNAKNSLDLNYLWFAEGLGATVLPETQVETIRPLDGGGGSAGYALETTRSTAWGGRPKRTIRAGAVVVAAGVMGSVGLLWRSKLAGHLPQLSERLGELVRTNSEAILAVTARDRSVDYSQGIAASSSVFPDEHTQIQADRYPTGSDLLAVLSTVLTDGGGSIPRPLRFLAEIARRPADFVRQLIPLDFARRSIVLIVMQDLDSSMRLVPRRDPLPPFGWRLSSRPAGERLPSYIPLANDFARRMAERMDGVPQSALSEVLLDAPATAHILGGCAVGPTPADGVVDLRHRAFGYRNLWVCDGSTIPANLGVNPALSILAFAERAMSFVPSRGARRALEVERAWGVERLLEP